MEAFDELPVLLVEASELRDDDILRTWCDRSDDAVSDIHPADDCACPPVGRQDGCVLVYTVDKEPVRLVELGTLAEQRIDVF